MTCGVCSPESFEAALDHSNILGYTSTGNVKHMVRCLYFQGARYVDWDINTDIPFLKRDSIKHLLRMSMVGGAVIICSHRHDIHKRSSNRNKIIDELEKQNIEIRFLSEAGRGLFNEEQDQILPRNKVLEGAL